GRTSLCSVHFNTAGVYDSGPLRSNFFLSRCAGRLAPRPEMDFCDMQLPSMPIKSESESLHTSLKVRVLRVGIGTLVFFIATVLSAEAQIKARLCLTSFASNMSGIVVAYEE